MINVGNWPCPLATYFVQIKFFKAIYEDDHLVTNSVKLFLNSDH